MWESMERWFFIQVRPTQTLTLTLILDLHPDPNSNPNQPYLIQSSILCYSDPETD